MAILKALANKNLLTIKKEVERITSENKVRFSSEEVLKNLLISLVIIFLIIFLSILISRFGRGIYNKLYQRIYEITFDSLTRQTLSEYKHTALLWIENIANILENKILPAIDGIIK